MSSFIAFSSKWVRRSIRKPSLSHLSPPACRVRRSGKKIPLPVTYAKMNQVTPKKACVSKRDQKRIEVAATQAIDAVANVVDIAIEKDIEYVVGKFREKRELLFTISSLLDSDSKRCSTDEPKS